MCQNFEIAPVLKMFVSWHHQQLPRYFFANVKDTRADGYNAFCYHWDSDVVMYMNPHLSLLNQLIEKTIEDKSTVLLVTPQWFEASWYMRHWNQTLYIDKNGSLQKRPRWATVSFLSQVLTPTRLRSDSIHQPPVTRS